MIRKLTLSKLNLFIGGAAGLLVVGLAIEGLLTKPHLEEIRLLQAEKNRLWAEIDRQRDIEAESRAVAELLGAESLTHLTVPSQDDPIAYLNSLIEDAKLVRLGLTISGQKDIGSLQMHSYTLRAKGGFRQMQNFVQKVEGGDRLAAVDAFKIMPTLDAESLEGRFSLSIYDVKEER